MFVAFRCLEPVSVLPWCMSSGKGGQGWDPAASAHGPGSGPDWIGLLQLGSTDSPAWTHTHTHTNSYSKPFSWGQPSCIIFTTKQSSLHHLWFEYKQKVSKCEQLMVTWLHTGRSVFRMYWHWIYAAVTSQGLLSTHSELLIVLCHPTRGIRRN